MKLKKVLFNVLAVTTVATGVLGLAACGGGNETPETGSHQTETGSGSGSETNNNVDVQKVEAALKGVKLEASYDADFTLLLQGNGGVAFSWKSSNPDTIAIDGGNAKVTRPSFGAEAVKVTLTVTAVLNDATAEKSFEVTINPLVDESNTVAEIKALEDNAVVKAKGVVTAFGYGKGFETPGSFYITDATGTIFVFGANVAKTVKLGDEIYFTAKKTTYKNAVQLSDPADCTILGSDKEADWTTVVKDKTLKDIATDLEGDYFGQVFEFVGRVHFDEKWGNYSLDAPEGYTEGKLGEYLSGSNGEIPADYAKALKGHENELVRVRFVINGKNSKGTSWRGHTIAVIPFTAEDQAKYGVDAAKAAIDALNLGRVMEAKTVELPTAVANMDKLTITYAVEGAGATLEANKLTFAPTAAIQKLTIKATITVEGADPVEYTVTSSIATSFDAQPISEVVALPANTSVIVEGIVVAKQYSTLIIFDGKDMITIYGKAVENVNLNDSIKVYGKLGMHNNTIQVLPDEYEALEALNIEKPAATALTDEMINALLADKVADVSYVEYVGTLQISGKYVNVLFDGVTKYQGSIKNTLTDAEKALDGKLVKVTGYINGVSGGKFLNTYFTSIVEEAPAVLTDAEKVEATAAALTKQLTLGTVSKVQSIVLENPHTATLAVVLPETAKTLAYDAASATLTVTPLEAETTEVVKITITVGAETKEITINVTSKLVVVVPGENQTVTVQYTGTDSKNMTVNANNAADLGLDANLFNVTTNEATSYKNTIGLNGAGNVRLYADKETGNGNEFTITAAEGVTIVSASIQFVQPKKGTPVAQVNGTTVDYGDYSAPVAVEVNGSSLVIKNATTGETAQLWFTTIELVYTVAA